MKKLNIELKNVPKGLDQSTLMALTAGEKEQQGTDLGYSLNLCSRKLKEISNKHGTQYLDLLATYRLRLEQHVEQAFEKNEKITGFCTHPQAEIRFETSDEIPVRSHPYRIPDSLQVHVDEYFSELLKKGVIEPETELNIFVAFNTSGSKERYCGKYQGLAPMPGPAQNQC